MTVITHTARLPLGFTVRFCLTADHQVTIEFSPALPRIGSSRARKRFQAAYLRERAKFGDMLAELLGGAVMFVGIGSAPNGVTLENFNISEPTEERVLQ